MRQARQTGAQYGPMVAGLYKLAIDPVLLSLRVHTRAVVQRLGATSVLDIGCGTGAQCRVLAEEGFQVTGVDLSPAMLRIAQRYSRGDVHYLQGSALELPFDDGKFDAALLSLVLHEQPEERRIRMLAEALRVVRDEGHLVVADYTVPPRRGVRPLWLGIWMVEHLAGRTHAAGFRDFIRRGAVEALLERSGLRPFRTSPVLRHTVGVAEVGLVPTGGRG